MDGAEYMENKRDAKKIYMNNISVYMNMYMYNICCIYHWTNLLNKGLISADRNSKATLPLTVPRSSSLSRLQRIYFPKYLKLWSGPVSYAAHKSHPRKQGRPLSTWFTVKRHIVIHLTITLGKEISLRSSGDSDLEAFSHNPADGSFAPLAVQPSANTKYPNQRFLSY